MDLGQAWPFDDRHWLLVHFIHGRVPPVNVVATNPTVEDFDGDLLGGPKRSSKAWVYLHIPRGNAIDFDVPHLTFGSVPCRVYFGAMPKVPE